jgi:hypothetical protein
MVKSIQYRKTSLLKPLVDKVRWWDMQGELFALGHILAALFEDLDRFKNSRDGNMADVPQYLQRCWKLDTDFQNWYRQLVLESPSPMYWRSEVTGDETTIVFTSLYHAHLMLDFWALQLTLTATIDRICSQVPKDIPIQMRHFTDRLRISHGPSRQIDLAITIMSSLSYCMNDEYGLASSQKCLFSGRVALFLLRRFSFEHLSFYEAKFMELTLKKGLRYAQDISTDMRSSWTADISERGPDLREQSDSD